MTAGKRAHIITVLSRVDQVNEAGTTTTLWADHAALRAEIVQRGTEEFQRGFGASDETTIIFRTLHLAGVTPDNRVRFDNRAFEVREVVTIGRRRGLELRCVALSGVDA